MHFIKLYCWIINSSSPREGTCVYEVVGSDVLMCCSALRVRRSLCPALARTLTRFATVVVLVITEGMLTSLFSARVNCVHVRR
jgi:hypothetical protein